VAGLAWPLWVELGLTQKIKKNEKKIKIKSVEIKFLHDLEKMYFYQFIH
jgi:hypothetical protein